MLDTIILDKLTRIQEELEKQKAFETDGEYAINNLRDRVEMLEKADDALSATAYIKLLERIEKLEAAYQADAQVARDIIFEGARRNEAMRKISADFETHCEAILFLEQNVKGLLDDMKKTEHYIYGEGDIGALSGRIDNLEKNDKFDDHQRDMLEKRIFEVERFQDVTDLQYKQLKHNEVLLDIKPQVESLTLQHKNMFEWLERIDKIITTIPDFKETDHDERIHDLENINAESRLIRLEAYNKMDEGMTPSDLFLRLCQLEEVVQLITEDDMKAGRKPHVCPICNGDGTYRENGIIYFGRSCNVCEGKGIVWG